MLVQVPRLEEIGDFEEAYVIGRPPIGVKLQDAIPTGLRLLLSALTAYAETPTSLRRVSKHSPQSEEMNHAISALDSFDSKPSEPVRGVLLIICTRCVCDVSQTGH